MTDHLILRDFQLSRDFRSVDWKATGIFNSIRAGSGAVTWTTILLATALASTGKVPQNGLFEILKLPFALFLGYWIITFPLTMFGSLISKVPFAGLFLLILALPVAVGDPVTCVIKKFAPNVVPVEDPPLFSLTAIYWVIKGKEMTISN